MSTITGYIQEKLCLPCPYDVKDSRASSVIKMGISSASSALLVPIALIEALARNAILMIGKTVHFFSSKETGDIFKDKMLDSMVMNATSSTIQLCRLTFGIIAPFFEPEVGSLVNNHIRDGIAGTYLSKIAIKIWDAQWMSFSRKSVEI